MLRVELLSIQLISFAQLIETLLGIFTLESEVEVLLEIVLVEQ